MAAVPGSPPMPPMPRKRFQNSSIDEREQNRPLASSRRIAYDPFITPHTHPVRVPVPVTIDSKFVVLYRARFLWQNTGARGKTRTGISADCSEVLRLRRRCVAHDRCRAFAKTARLRRATTPVTPIFVAMYCDHPAGRGDCSKQHLQAALPESEKVPRTPEKSLSSNVIRKEILYVFLKLF